MSRLSHGEAADCRERIVGEDNAAESGRGNHRAAHPDQPPTPLEIARYPVEPIRKSASAKAPDCSDAQRHCSVKPGAFQVEAMFLPQVGGQPSHKKVEAVGKRKVGPKQS